MNEDYGLFKCTEFGAHFEHEVGPEDREQVRPAKTKFKQHSIYYNREE